MSPRVKSTLATFRRRSRVELRSILPVQLGAVRSVVVTPEPSVGVAAGLMTIALTFWNLHIVTLLILVVGAGGVDLLVGARRATLSTGDAAFRRERLDDGAINKLVILAVTFFLGIAADTLIVLLGRAADLGFTAPFQALTPATAALLLYRLLREIASIMRNVEHTPGGRDAIWPGLSRVVDTLRYRLAVDPAADQVPDRRWQDTLSTEEVEFVERMLAARRAGGAQTPESR